MCSGEVGSPGRRAERQEISIQPAIGKALDPAGSSQRHAAREATTGPSPRAGLKRSRTQRVRDAPPLPRTYKVRAALSGEMVIALRRKPWTVLSVERRG